MSNNQQISKRQYVLTASRVVSQEGLAGLSIRRLARELDCNTANLYRYFDGLDELCMYASLPRLAAYLRDLGGLFHREQDPLKKYFGIWDLFCRHAFANAPYFDLLFFSKYQNRLYEIMREYYAMFNEEMEDLGELRTIFLQGDFDYRDYLLIRNCAEAGAMERDDAVMLTRVAVNLFRGFFKQVLEHELRQEEQALERRRFMESLYFVYGPYIKEDWQGTLRGLRESLCVLPPCGQERSRYE